MTKIKNLSGGGSNLLAKKDKSKGILEERQLDEIKQIGVCMLITAGNNGQPHCTIVEPSRFFESEIVIPIVQMVTSINNIKENNKIFIHVTKENKEYFGDSTQYKIEAVAKIEKKGKLFDEVKHFEETERLPEGWTVKGIVRAKLMHVEEVVG